MDSDNNNNNNDNNIKNDDLSLHIINVYESSENNYISKNYVPIKYEIIFNYGYNKIDPEEE